ncbi:MAG: pinensin family lanthipeptide [Cyclobacteriaceae bacterium]
MKKVKLTINELKVKSFVTDFDAEKSKTIGGKLDTNKVSLFVICPIGPPDDTYDNDCTDPQPSYQPGGTCDINCPG